MIRFRSDDCDLTGDEFLDLCSLLWHRPLDPKMVDQALSKTINITARDGGRLVGCTRIISDGYLHSAITEVLVHPDFSSHGIGERLVSLAFECPERISFSVEFSLSMRDLCRREGWQRGFTAFFRRKPLS